jgi:hypothetical protein
MQCPSCGTILREGAQFCGVCGQRASTQTPAPEAPVAAQPLPASPPMQAPQPPPHVPQPPPAVQGYPPQHQPVVPVGYPQQQWQQPHAPRPPRKGLPPLLLLVGIGVGLGIVFGAANVVYGFVGFEVPPPKAQLVVGYLIGVALSALSTGLWLSQYGGGPGPAPGAVGGPPGASHPSTAVVMVLGAFAVTYGVLLALGALVG